MKENSLLANGFEKSKTGNSRLSLNGPHVDSLLEKGRFEYNLYEFARLFLQNNFFPFAFFSSLPLALSLLSFLDGFRFYHEGFLMLCYDGMDFFVNGA